MPKKRRCPHCRRLYVSNLRLKERQKTCGSSACQKILKEKNNAQWRRNNPGYGKNDYPRIKACMEKNPGYLKRYRRNHPEYVQKNRDAQKRRDRAKRVHLDIQAKLNRQPSEIVAQSKSIPWVSHLDIQDEFILKPLEITFFLSRFAHFPCLAIQAEMDFSSPLPDNGAINHGGGAYGCTMAHRS